MKIKLWVIGLILAVVILAASMVLGRGLAQEYSGQKWEYTGMIYVNENAQVFTGDIGTSLDLNKELDPGITIIEAFNILGAQGWEYVGVKDNPTTMYMFKRPAE